MQSLDNEDVLGGGYAPYAQAGEPAVIESPEKTVAELRAELDESEALRERMAELLTGVAHALKGDPGPLRMHDWSDLPKVAAETAKRAAKLAGPVPDDPMPVFVIQGKDRLAREAIEAYFTLCLAQGLTGQAAEVAAAAHKIREWQTRHPDLVKLPDHRAYE